jgi:class 3 adenylate cyclase/tetratricopeptide (TPR) repeat protein
MAAETRKLVTVVFCDLVGSTALSGRLDPETLRAVTLRYFDVMRQRIEAHGGTVEKFIGDAVMAVFGVPVMHEDDADRAARAALDMVDALATLNEELDPVLGVRLDIRIGVNTGEVVAATDTSPGHALVSGEVVNIAARLQQGAPAQGVLVGPATYHAARGTLVVAPAGPQHLKGKAQPVEAYRLLGTRPDDPELVRRFDTPFVGRDRELAALQRIAARVAGRQEGRQVLLCGDAGLGKTRLVREWQHSMTGNGMVFGYGRCRPHRDDGTLAPLAEALQPLLDNEPGSASTDGRAGRARMTVRSGLLADGTPAPSVADTCLALAELIRWYARTRPVAVVVDDCQWADEQLLDVIDRLAAELASSAALIVCLARPDVFERWTRWTQRHPTIDRIGLGPLATEHCARLAAELAEVNSHSATGQVLQRAEGNPFVLEQLLAALAETGRHDELPLTIQALLAARVDRLPAGERAVLDLAAIAGRDFTLETLARLVDRPADAPLPDHLPALAGRLVRRRLIEAADRDRTRYRFASMLVHEVTYQAIPKGIRAQLHHRLARILENAGAGAAVVGGHLERAYRHRAALGLHDRYTEEVRVLAAQQLTAAGHHALARADVSWSEHLLSRAAELAHPPDTVWRMAAQGLGEARIALGRTGDGKTLLRDALAAAVQALDEPAMAHARLQLATLDPGPAMAELARVARRSIPVFQAAGDDLGLARAYLRMGQRLQFLGRHAAAARCLAVSLRHSARIGAEPELATALGAQGISWWLGPVPAAAGVAQCLALLSRDAGTRAVVRLAVHCPLAVLLAVRHRFAEAYACLAVADELAGRLDYAEAACFLPMFRAHVQLAAGRQAQAEESLREAVSACRRSGDTSLLASASRDLARVLLDRGDFGSALSLVDMADPPRAPSDAADLYGLRARLAAQSGHRRIATRLAARARAAAYRTDSPVSQALAALDQAQTYRRLGRTDRATHATAAARRRFRDKGHLAGLALVRGTRA